MTSGMIKSGCVTTLSKSRQFPIAEVDVLEKANILVHVERFEKLSPDRMHDLLVESQQREIRSMPASNHPEDK